MAELSSYAAARGLSPAGEDAFLRTAPFLESFKEVQAVIAGALPGGIDGVIAHITIRKKTGSSARTFKNLPFTVVQTAVPESIGFMPTLLLRDNGQRFRNIGTYREGGRPDRQVKLESSALKKRARVYARVEQDQGWVRELFTPTFIDWLAHGAPEDFGFDLEEGSLTSISSEHVTDPARLDALCEATATVAARLREEALEDHAVGSTVNPQDVKPEPDQGMAGAIFGGTGRRLEREREHAFLGSYAQARGLQLVGAREYHAANADLALPGIADAVLAGPIPCTAITGEVVLATNTADRKNPVPVDILVAEAATVGRPQLGSPADFASLGAGAGGGKVWAFRYRPAETVHNVESLDGFCCAAAAFLGAPVGAAPNVAG